MIAVYGYSDDLVEVEGCLTAEFGCYDEGLQYLAFSDGTVLSVDYSNGLWRINRIVKGEAEYTKAEAVGDGVKHESLPGALAKSVPGHSDVVILSGDMDWVTFGKHFRRRDPGRCGAVL